MSAFLIQFLTEIEGIDRKVVVTNNFVSNIQILTVLLYYYVIYLLLS